MSQRYFQVYKPLLECEDLRHEFQFLVLNIYNEGNLGYRTLTCSSLIPLPKDTSKYIRQFPPPRLLKEALKPDTKMIYRRYSKLESWNQTCLPMGLALASSNSR